MKHIFAAVAIALAAATSASAAVITDKFSVSSAVGSGADHSVWIRNGIGPGIGSDFDFDPDGMFTMYDDGTAKLTGSVKSQGALNAGFKVSFDYNNVFSWGAPVFKSENGSAATSETIYRNLTGGTLLGTGILEGLTLSVTRNPPNGPYATQIGPSNGVNNGANNKNKNFGMAHWFLIEVERADCKYCAKYSDYIKKLDGRQGDVNVDLTPVPVPAAGFLLVGGLALMGGMARRRRKSA